VPVFAGRLVDVGHPGGEAVPADGDLAGHGVRDQGQPPGPERRLDQDGGAREVRVGRAAAVALAAVVARRTAVERPRQDRQARGDAGDPEPIARLLDEQLVTTRLRRRQEDPVRIVAQPFAAAEDPDQPVDPIVVGRDVLVADRPVIAQSVDALAPEVVGPEAERDPAPVVGAAPEHPGAEPVEARAGRRGVGLARDLPTPVAGVELAERALARRCAPARGLVDPAQHRAVAGAVPFAAGLEHDDAGAGLREHVGGHPATRAGTDDTDVVLVGRLPGGHVSLLCDRSFVLVQAGRTALPSAGRGAGHRTSGQVTAVQAAIRSVRPGKGDDASGCQQDNERTALARPRRARGVRARRYQSPIHPAAVAGPPGGAGRRSERLDSGSRSRVAASRPPLATAARSAPRGEEGLSGQPRPGGYPTAVAAEAPWSSSRRYRPV